MALSHDIVVTPKFRAEDNCPPVNKVAITFVVLETVIFIAFWISRHFKKPSTYPILPWLMTGGYLFSCSIAIESLWACNLEFGGGGHHIVLIPLPALMRRLKINKAIEWCCIPACTFSKFVILLLYYSIFARHRRGLRYACYAISITVIVLVIYGIISPALACRPFAYNWDKTIEGGNCIDLAAAYRWVSLPNVVTDIALMTLCFPSIYRVQLPLITKIGLFTTFGIGSIGIVTSILRFVHFWRTDIFTDLTYNSKHPLIWTLVEPGVYLLAAALLQMNPLFVWLFKGIKLLETHLQVTAHWSRSQK